MTTEKRRKWSDKERYAIGEEFLPPEQKEKPWAAAVLASNLTVALLDARADLAEVQEEIARVKLKGAIEALAWAQNEATLLAAIQDLLRVRIAELRAELEKLK